LLYLPRGMQHEVEALDVDTLHLNIGALQITWVDVLAAACANFARREPAARRAIPFDSLRSGPDAGASRELASLLRGLADSVDAAESFSTLAESFRRYQRTGGVRRAAGRTRAPLHARSAMQRAREVDGALEVEPGGARIRFRVDGREVDLPGRFEAAMRFVLATRRFCVADLPELDETSQIELAQRLVRVGLIATNSPSASGSQH
jgi:hypothetical protein